MSALLLLIGSCIKKRKLIIVWGLEDRSMFSVITDLGTHMNGHRLSCLCNSRKEKFMGQCSSADQGLCQVMGVGLGEHLLLFMLFKSHSVLEELVFSELSHLNAQNQLLP